MISTQPGQPSLAREDSSLAPQASKKVDRGSHLQRLPFTKKGSYPAPQAFKKGRQVPERLRAPGAGVKDFVPWVSLISSHPPASEEEEEEDEMVDLVHNFDAWKHKRGASFKRATDATLEVVGEADQHSTGEGSDVQAIVVSDLLEIGFHCQSALETAISADLGEVSLTHVEVLEDTPSGQVASRQDKATSTLAGRGRPLLPDRLFLNSYIPPQGQAPPVEEVLTPGLEGSQEIINL